MDAEDATGTAELVVDGTEKDLPDPELSKKGRAHNTGFDRDVEHAFGDDRRVDARRWVKLLSVRVEVAILGVNIAPRLFRGRWWRGGIVGIVGLVCVRTSLSSFAPPRFRSGRIRSEFVRFRVVGEEGADGHELSMSGAIPSDVGGIHASGDDLSMVYEDASNWSFIGDQS